MRLAALTALFVLSCSLAPSAGADEEKLPAQLAGTGSTTPESGKKTIAPWSISIVSQDLDGNLKGTLNWNGRSCQISAVAFTGTYRNGVLDISAPSTSRTCGAIVSGWPGALCANWVQGAQRPGFAERLSLSRYDDENFMRQLRGSAGTGVL